MAIQIANNTPQSLSQTILNINNELKYIYTNGKSTTAMSWIRRTLNIQLLLLLLKPSEKGEQIMTQEELNQLVRIYNTLLTINTKGDDTLIMADCIRALKQSIEGITIISEDSKAE